MTSLCAPSAAGTDGFSDNVFPHSVLEMVKVRVPACSKHADQGGAGSGFSNLAARDWDLVSRLCGVRIW